MFCHHCVLSVLDACHVLGVALASLPFLRLDGPVPVLRPSGLPIRVRAVADVSGARLESVSLAV